MLNVSSPGEGEKLEEGVLVWLLARSGHSGQNARAMYPSHPPTHTSKKNKIK